MAIYLSFSRTRAEQPTLSGCFSRSVSASTMLTMEAHFQMRFQDADTQMCRTPVLTIHWNILPLAPFICLWHADR